MTPITLQKLNWKLFFDTPVTVKSADFFQVFNTWIPDSPEIFVDVASYAHVHDGPLIILVGHYVDYSLDASNRQLGLLYSYKKPMAGTNLTKLTTTLTAALSGSQRLESDPLFAGAVSLRTNELCLIANDRGLVPNTAETYAALEPDLRTLADQLYGKGHAVLSHDSANSPKQRFAARITADRMPALTDLIATLA